MVPGEVVALYGDLDSNDDTVPVRDSSIGLPAEAVMPA